MVGLGTVINACGVLAGGIMGLLIGKMLKQRFADILVNACGLCVIFIGASGALQKIFLISNGVLETNGTLMMVLSMAIGSILGELINLEKKTQQFGNWLKLKTNNVGDSRFITGFVSASFTICIGAMAIIGPMNDAMYGDYSILITKTILDTIIVLVMTASLGKGAIFSAIPLVLIQGLFTVFGRIIKPFMNQMALDNLSLVGSILIFCIGINLVFDKKIKVANMLPALVICVVFGFLGIS